MSPMPAKACKPDRKPPRRFSLAVTLIACFLIVAFLWLLEFFGVLP